MAWPIMEISDTSLIIPERAADDRDMAANPRRVDRFLQRARAAHFQNVIDASSAPHFACLYFPLRRLSIVDQHVGAEFFCARELRIR
jgi:hypothetical protein